MTTFVHAQFNQKHPGVERVVAILEKYQAYSQPFEGAKGLAALLLGALVSSLLVVANQVIDAWSDGHLMAAWIALWIVAFSSLALFDAPVRCIASNLRKSVKHWIQARTQDRQNEKTWAAAQQDPALMAELTVLMLRA
jgi:hypothetical protein